MKRYKTYLVNSRFISARVLELSVARSNSRSFPDFLPGQYATLSFPLHQKLRGERSFSIASSPTDSSVWRFGIKIFGRYTSALQDLRPGEPVMVGGPFGKFSFDQFKDQSAVFLAGGIGITPFVSMIRWATNKKLSNDLTLFYSVRSLADAPYREDFYALEMLSPHLKVIYVTSDLAGNDPSARIISGRINADLIARFLLKKLEDKSYFICGPLPFMKAMEKIIGGFGVPKQFIKTEKFGIGSKAFIETGSPMPKIAFAAWGLAAAVVFGVVVRMEQARRSNAATQNLVNSPSIEATNNNAPGSAVPSMNNVNQAAPITNTSQPSVSNNNSQNQSSGTITQPSQPFQSPRAAPFVPRTRMS
ncbi:MAG: hypothetical protein COT26_00880 [Candidatus Kerfeldbacteria bacterium CG08_land_8_20_14_0_20_43_14]|uniref:FAD-binding FR-type domain-containing protein n=1 Tax=Candidatus Kerfeldbacteria bacterium CG08_land_8_20_14_0_20_43_14 TaxID=2014246 RepID=A0A2H0YQY1_9BACT|nr:MAG: hypothetical protein COT26_00880 [Candidatus Kerfeldbacteria bacterium CG08_land_8_20_14_0_20_43_14]